MEETQNNPTTVGRYLLDALYKQGVEHIFGVPGDYVLKFNKQIESHPTIQFINATRETTAGEMADAYGRIRGLGVACITYGVGVNIANPISQSLVEHSSLLVISGAPSNAEFTRSSQIHHVVGGSLSTQLEIFSKLTCISVRLENLDSVSSIIDSVINLCISQRKPAYLELPRDLVDQFLPSNHNNVGSISSNISSSSSSSSSSGGNSGDSGSNSGDNGNLHEGVMICGDDYDMKKLEKVVKATIQKLQSARCPVIWVGREISAYNVKDSLLKFIDRTRIPFTTNLLGKSTISEDHPLALGVYMGGMSREGVAEFVESSDLLLNLGVPMNDVDTGMFSAHLPNNYNMIIVCDHSVKIDGEEYHNIEIKPFIEELLKYINDLPQYVERELPPGSNVIKLPFILGSSETATTISRVYECLQSLLASQPQNSYVLCADVGDSLFSCTDLHIGSEGGFFASAHFATLGFAVPASIGAALANSKRRSIAVVGDGAFQITGIELATAVRYGLDPIVIVLNNHGFGTERPLLEGRYNDIGGWNYSELPRLVGGGRGVRVNTEAAFFHELSTSLSQRGVFSLIEVELDKLDFSPALRRMGQLLKGKI